MTMAVEPTDWLWRASTWRNVLIALVATLALTAAFSYWMNAVGLTREHAIAGFKHLSATEVQTRLGALKPEWKRFYLQSTRTLDLLYPVAYSLLFAFLIGALLRAAHAPPPFRALQLVPFLAAAADYAENVFILLFAGGRRSAEAVAPALALLTPAKWWLLALSALIAAALALWALAHRS